MKKFIGVLLTVVLCACMTMPVAFASAEDAIVSGISDLIGGFVFDVDDYLVDSSVKRQLELIRRQFIRKNRRIV